MHSLWREMSSKNGEGMGGTTICEFQSESIISLKYNWWCQSKSVLGANDGGVKCRSAEGSWEWCAIPSVEFRGLCPLKVLKLYVQSVHFSVFWHHSGKVKRYSRPVIFYWKRLPLHEDWLSRLNILKIPGIFSKFGLGGQPPPLCMCLTIACIIYLMLLFLLFVVFS